MEETRIPSYEEYVEKMRGCVTASDVSKGLKELFAPTIQTMLEKEMEYHLGYAKNDVSGNNSGNSRNGYSKKKLKTSFGTTEIEVPRDRNGGFDPIVVKKGESVESDIEEKIIAMYAKGMSTRDINEYMGDIYGVSISADMVSGITDKILPMVEEWQDRPLSPIYPIVYFDGIHFKVRSDGKIVSKCAYIGLGINTEGIKEILGIYVGENEGAKFWMRVLDDIRKRGTEKILIASIDGLSGFPEAIRGVFPKTQIQRCVVHQIRNTTKYIPSKDMKPFCADLKTIYRAKDEDTGYKALQEMKEKWKEYEIYLKSWEVNWKELSTFFAYPEEIRRIMYTTNAIESLNRQFRKVTKTTSIFPHDKSLRKLLFLAQRDISKKWTSPIHNWGKIYAQILILFEEEISEVQGFSV